MKAIIYARVSTSKQEEANTIETQLDFIRNDPAVKAQFEIETDAFLDDGVSGYRKPLWERPAGQRLMAQARDGQLEGVTVLVYKLNRLGRRMIDTEAAIDELLNHGVGIYACKDHLTLNNTPTGKMMRQMMSIFSEFDRNNMVENIRDGMERKARAGELMPPYIRLGYEWDSFDADGRKAKGAAMVINPVEADLLRRIFDLYEEKKAYHAVTRWLNDNGYRMPRKSPRFRERYGTADRLFYAADVKRILADALYTGVVEWGKKTRMQGGKPTPYSHHRPELQIISFEQFNRVQRLTQLNHSLPAKSISSLAIYSGLLRCPLCGGGTSAMRFWNRKSETNERLYRCNAYHLHGKSACLGWKAREGTIGKAVIPFLANLLENRLNLRQYVEAEARQMMWEEHEGKVERLQGEREAAQGQLKRIQKLMIDGLLSDEEGRPYVYEARETIERAGKQIEAIQQRLELRDDLAEAVARVCDDVQGALERLNPEALQAVVRQVFKNFSIGKRGGGRHNAAWLDKYEFREEVKGLLADSGLSVSLARPGRWDC